MRINVFKTFGFWLILIIFFGASLRLFHLDRYPPSLYSDEVNQGYNAYALSQTGQDEYGVFLPVSLRSFGDWKPPLSTYLMIPFITFFGLNEITVRLPSALLGIITVYLSYLLVKQFVSNKGGEKAALVTGFIIAISPWHIHQSRSAMLVMVALATVQLATVAFFWGFKKKAFMVLAAVFFALAIYSYYGMRLIVPLWFLTLVLFFRKQILIQWKVFFMAGIVGIACLFPLIYAFISEPNVIFGRAKTVSIFYDRGVDLKLWEFASEEPGYLSQATRFFHNKVYQYAREITQRFLSHLGGQFLFLRGDSAPPFMIPNMGVLYLVDGIFILLGFWFLTKDNSSRLRLLLIWSIISLLPAALTYQTPSQNRTFTLLFALGLLGSYGWVSLSSSILPRMKLLLFVLVIIYSININFYLKQYFLELPVNFSDQWLYGMKQVVTLTNEPALKDKHILFLPKTNIAYIYFLFYNKVDPVEFREEVQRDNDPDEFGFEHVQGFGRYTSLRKGTWHDILIPANTIIVGKDREIPQDKVNKRITYPNGQTAYDVSIL